MSTCYFCNRSGVMAPCQDQAEAERCHRYQEDQGVYLPRRPDPTRHGEIETILDLIDAADEQRPIEGWRGEL